MAITDIRLQKFRSYTDSSFEFSDGVNIIVGPNASGKTSLLEAILMVSGYNSWRAKVNSTVKFNKPWARLDAHMANGQRTLKITTEPTGRLYELDGSSYKRLPTGKKLALCLFEPNHLLILNGSPEARREYLDDLAEKIYPAFGSSRRKYQRALAQRNHLLKLGQKSARTQIFSWNIRLSELAGQIIASRLDLIQEIDGRLNGLYQELAGSKDKTTVNYKSELPISHYETALLKRLDDSFHEELARGYTLSGPHRDDLQISINNEPSSVSASRGETRTLTLALKIIEALAIEKAAGKKPILLLDDVFSELDGARRQKLTHYLKNYQTFITTTDADVVLQHFTGTTNIIPLNK